MLNVIDKDLKTIHKMLFHSTNFETNVSEAFNYSSAQNSL